MQASVESGGDKSPEIQGSVRACMFVHFVSMLGGISFVAPFLSPQQNSCILVHSWSFSPVFEIHVILLLLELVQFMNAFDRAMNLLDDKFSILASTKQIVSSTNNEDKVNMSP